MDRDYNKTWLDVYIGIHNPKLRFHQYDASTQTFLIKITRNEEVIENLDNALVTLVAIKPDKSVEAQFIETQDGFFYADLKPSMRDIPGDYEAKAFVVLNGESIVSDVIRYNVSEDNEITKLNNSVVDTEDYSLLTEMIKRLANIEANEISRQEYFEELKSQIDYIMKGLHPDEGFHIHENKDVIDTISQSDIDNWNGKADNLFKTDMDIVSSLGGIKTGDNLNNMSIQDVLTKLLYPYVEPNINSYLTYTPIKSIFEVGETIQVRKINTEIAKKSNSIEKIEFLYNNEVLATLIDGISNGGNFSHTFPNAITLSTNTPFDKFQVKVYDGNKEFTSNTYAFTFIRPFYYGVCNIEDTIASNMLNKDLSVKGDKTYNFNLDNQCIVIAYPIEYGLLSSIIDINGFEISNSFEHFTQTLYGLYGLTHDYYVYKSSPSTNTNFKVQFKF